ncbi:hypothetical protein QOZ80_5AG0382400 [Eleusine coracana subsp. coracana]|nr:hypothetical protein QOZ80_5AG0382400 [Eleusine coracana subsp. coracana]
MMEGTQLVEGAQNGATAQGNCEQPEREITQVETAVVVKQISSAIHVPKEYGLHGKELITRFGSFHYSEDNSRRRTDTREFRLWAWCPAVRAIPRRIWVTITDSDADGPATLSTYEQMRLHLAEPTASRWGLAIDILVHLEVIADLERHDAHGGPMVYTMDWTHGAPDDHDAALDLSRPMPWRREAAKHSCSAEVWQPRRPGSGDDKDDEGDVHGGSAPQQQRQGLLQRLRWPGDRGRTKDSHMPLGAINQDAAKNPWADPKQRQRHFNLDAGEMATPMSSEQPEQHADPMFKEATLMTTMGLLSITDKEEDRDNESLTLNGIAIEQGDQEQDHDEHDDAAKKEQFIYNITTGMLPPVLPTPVPKSKPRRHRPNGGNNGAEEDSIVRRSERLALKQQSVDKKKTGHLAQELLAKKLGALVGDND